MFLHQKRIFFWFRTVGGFRYLAAASTHPRAHPRLESGGVRALVLLRLDDGVREGRGSNLALDASVAKRAPSEIFQEFLLHRLLVRARRVVSRALLRVGEHVVRALNGGEGGSVAALIGVVLRGRRCASMGMHVRRRTRRVGSETARVASRDRWSPRGGTPSRGGQGGWSGREPW